MSSATMQLLKKNAKTEAAEPVALTAEAIQIMAGTALSEYVLNAGIDITDFAKMKVADKRAALIAHLWDDPPVEASEEAVAETVKSKSGKTLTTGKTKTQEVLDPDPIATTVHEMSELIESEVTPKAIRLLEDMEFNSFQLGGVLSRVQEMGWFGEHPNLKDYAQETLGLKYRKAMYLIEIFDGLVELNIPWDKVKNVGWSKLRYLLPVLTAKNAAMWAKKAAEVNTMQLQEMVKEAQASNESVPSEEPPATNVTTMSFKVHTDQRETITEAIKRAQEQSGTEVATVALEHICIEYLGAPDAGKVSLLKAFKKLKKDLGEEGLTEVFGAFEKVWPEVELTVRMPD